MKNKFAKLLVATVLGTTIAGSAIGFTACKKDDNNSNNGGGNNHTHNYVWVDDDNGTTHHKHCDVEGCDAPDLTAENHTWSAADECETCGAYKPLEMGASKVPEYKGEAAGPVAGEQNFTSQFLASDIGAGTLESDWSDGIYTVLSGSEIRSRKDTTNKYTHSVKNNTVKVNVPVEGKLTIDCANGSTGGPSKYKITKPDNSSEEVEVATGDKVLSTKEINVVPGVYTFANASGTIDFFAFKLEFTSDSTPIQSIEVANAGTTDYLVMQEVDCTGVTLTAKDANGISYPVKLENCTFDTSKYNPNKSGEYEIGVTYHLSDNLDSDTTSFTATYKVKVYMVDSIELSTIGLASSKQVTVQQAYLPDATFNSNYLSVIATCSLGTSSIQQKLKNEWYTISTPTLTAEGTKEVTVSVSSRYTTGHKSVSATYDVVVKAKKDVVDNKVELTVGETGEFKTLTQAAQYLKACNYAATVNKVIKLQAGTYTEKVWLDIDNVTLMGLGNEIDDTVLSYSLVEGDADKLSNSLWGLNCATLHVTGANFKAYNLAIRNDFDYMANNKNYSGSQAAQGLALTLEGDGNVLYSCHLFGNQDTLYMKSGRSYFKETQIDGNIDFIFGGEKGLAYFEECEIVAIDREGKESTNPQNGYVTAPQHKAETKPDYGYIFYKCNLTDDGKVNAGAMALGRPWGPAATVSYIECKFSAAYSQNASDSTFIDNGKEIAHKIHRWNDMSGNLPENADYSEYGSMDSEGNPIMQTAVKGGKVLDAATAANYTKANIFGTSNGKSGYNTVFDCDTAYSNLRILVGLDEGNVAEDPVKKYDLLGYTGGQLQGVGGTGEYLGIKIDATNGKFNNRGNDIQINANTILYVPMDENYEISIADNKNSPLSAANYSVSYVEYEGAHYAKITFTSQSYITSISVDTDKTVSIYSVSFNLNGATGTAPATQEVVSGGMLLSVSDPIWEGHTFLGWFTAAEGGDEVNLSSYTVTTAVTLYAHWSEGAAVLEAVLIEEAKDFNFGKGTGDRMAYVTGEKVVNGLLINGTTSANNDWTKVNKDTTITLKVKAGLSVEFTLYKSANFEVYIDSVKQEITGTGTEGSKAFLTVGAQTADVEIMLKCTVADYIGAITVA